MLLFLLHYLTSYFNLKIPAAFSYSSTRMLLAAITSLLCTIFLGPFFIQRLYQLKTGQSIRVEDCPVLAQLHQKKKDTPTMGGTLILFSMILSLFLWMDLTHSFTFILLLVTLWLGIVGGYDDYLKMRLKSSKGLRARKKFLLQVGLATIIGAYLFLPGVPSFLGSKHWLHPPVAKEYVHVRKDHKKSELQTKTLSTDQFMSRYYVPFFKDPFFILKSGWTILGILFVIFVLTGSSNAVNLTDGLDGLASGTLVLTAGVLAVFAFLSNNMAMSRYLNILYIEGSGEIAIYLCALIGAALGFLWYNSHPAQIFMGDTGSLALGGIIGISSILLRREVLLALAGGIFVMEALSVIIQVSSYRLRNKKRVFLCAPLHHHFEYRGWSETKVVLRFWIVGLVLAMIALISLKFQ